MQLITPQVKVLSGGWPAWCHNAAAETEAGDPCCPLKVRAGSHAGFEFSNKRKGLKGSDSRAGTISTRKASEGALQSFGAMECCACACQGASVPDRTLSSLSCLLHFLRSAFCCQAKNARSAAAVCLLLLFTCKQAPALLPHPCLAPCSWDREGSYSVLALRVLSAVSMPSLCRTHTEPLLPSCCSVLL